jgi:glyoxylase-like metal-dependent hydrolase (beta-lactamase superfamily II)
MTISRRDTILGTTAIALAAGAPDALRAQSPSRLQTQVQGIYRQKIGSVSMTCITDGSVSFPREDGFVSNVPASEVATALEASFRSTDKITLTFAPVVLDLPGRLIVVDTGIGPAAFKSSNGIGGQFHRNLAVAGYDAKAVQQVLITHFHADHISGLLSEDGTSAFPNAEICVPAAEYAFWMDDGNASRASSAVVRTNFERAKRFMTTLDKQIRRYDADKEVAPGVTSIATPGHTPGHSSFFVSSEGESIILQGDVTTTPELFVEHPDWHVWSDMDPVVAEQARRKLYELAAANKTLIHGFHFNFPALGRVSKQGAGYRLVPEIWNAAPNL